MNKPIIISCTFICLSLALITGCFGADKQTSEIKGRFVFDSNRIDVPDIFITESGKTKLLFKQALAPAWSSDGERIACAGSDGNPKKHGLLIIDAKGNKKEFIEIPAGFVTPTNSNWSPDDTKIYYVPTLWGKKLGRENKVYCYDFLSKTHVKIIELDEEFRITELRLSPKGDKLMIDGADKHNLYTYLSNNDGTNLRIIRHRGVDSAWYPDNEHIAYLAFFDENGQRYTPKSEWGYFIRMNVNTGEVEKLWLCKTPFLLNLKISKDGKYIYYTAPAPGGGRAIFVSPIDNPDKKIQITESVYLKPATYGRSQDWNPDWYQE